MIDYKKVNDFANNFDGGVLTPEFMEKIHKEMIESLTPEEIIYFLLVAFAKIRVR